MKYLLWVLVIALAWWLFTRPRKSTQSKTEKSAAPAQDMAQCAHCGVHLPQDEAVRGDKGLYCSTEHRSAAQDRNPA
jgi:uncharacterized protein